jgi:hypothetical protein
MAISDQILAAAAGARNSRALDELSRLTWRAHGEGHVTDADAEAVSAAVRARQQAFAAGKAFGPPPPEKAAYAPRRPVRRWPRSPDRRKSLQRRRQLAGSGMLPPALRGYYTQGEAACLAVIAQEVRSRGLCDLSNAKIAALAGVESRTTVRNALAAAVRLGHATRELRPIEAFRNDTNIIRLVDRGWLAWLRLGRKEGGSKSVARTHGFSFFKRKPGEKGTKTGESTLQSGKGRVGAPSAHAVLLGSPSGRAGGGGTKGHSRG